MNDQHRNKRGSTSHLPVQDVTEALPHPVESAAQPASKTPPRVTRKSPQDITVPQNQTNIGALRFLLRSLDMFIITAVIMISMWSAYIGTNNNNITAPITVGVLGALSFITMLSVTKAHQFWAQETYETHMRNVLIASTSALGLWLAFALVLRPETFLPDRLAQAGLFATLALFISHSLYFLRIRPLHKQRRLSPNIVMLGATESARRLIEENARRKDLNIIAIFDERLSRAPRNIHGVPVVGKISDLMNWDQLPFIDQVVVTLPSAAQARKKAFVEQIQKIPNRISFVIDEFENLNHVQQRISQIAAINTRDVTGDPKSGRHVALKRMMDVAISATALVLGLPVLVLIAILIRLDSPGPVLFKQTRHGFNNRVFDVYKFRSMRKELEDKKAAQQVKVGDMRVTKIGRFIRKTSLDELPQLFNVFMGDMSLVGPRPHAIGMRTGDVESYKLVEDYAHRHKVKPGMTGWAQINGSRGPLHSQEDVARRVKLDVEYIERSSVLFDIMIMLKTLPVLLGDKENTR